MDCREDRIGKGRCGYQQRLIGVPTASQQCFFHPDRLGCLVDKLKCLAIPDSEREGGIDSRPRFAVYNRVNTQAASVLDPEAIRQSNRIHRDSLSANENGCIHLNGPPSRGNVKCIQINSSF